MDSAFALATLVLVTIRIVGRVIPFVAFGMAISARCRRVRTAILITTGTIFVVCVSLFVLLSAYGVLSAPQLARAQAYSVLAWPLSPNSYDGYTAQGLFSMHWLTDLCADGLWLIVFPALCTYLAIHWSRTRGTDYRTEIELERRQHGL